MGPMCNKIYSFDSSFVCPPELQALQAYNIPMIWCHPSTIYDIKCYDKGITNLWHCIDKYINYLGSIDKYIEIYDIECFDKGMQNLRNVLAKVYRI